MDIVMSTLGHWKLCNFIVPDTMDKIICIFILFYTYCKVMLPAYVDYTKSNWDDPYKMPSIVPDT